MRDRKAARRREFAAAQRAAILRTISNAEPTSGGAEAKPASAHVCTPGAPLGKRGSTGNSDPGFRAISGPKGLSSR